MKKKSFSNAKRYRSKSWLKRNIKFLKKERAKKARKAKIPQSIYKTTGAWDIN